MKLIAGERQQVLNPIRIEVQEEETVTYRVMIDEKEVFSGQGTGGFMLQVNDLIAPYLETVRPPETGKEICSRVNDFFKSCKVVFDKDGKQTVIDFTAFPGGIPGKLMEEYIKRQTDIFKERLLEPSANFLMTDRTDNTRMEVPETEIFPFYFIFPKNGLIITDGYTEIELEGNEGEVYTLDIEALRYRIFREQKRLSDKFTLKCGMTGTINIAIVKEEPAPERYRLIFRNSFGVYEKITLPGMGTVRPEWEEQTYYNVYDKDTDVFLRNRIKRKSRNVLEVTTEAIDKNRIKRVWQMLASEDVMLLTQEEYYPVDVECEEYQYNAAERMAQGLTLRISMNRQEEIITNRVTDIFMEAGIFVEQFDRTFV